MLSKTVRRFSPESKISALISEPKPKNLCSVPVVCSSECNVCSLTRRASSVPYSNQKVTSMTEWRQTFVTSRCRIEAIFTGALATVGANLKKERNEKHLPLPWSNNETKPCCKEQVKSSLSPVSLSTVPSYSKRRRQLLPQLTCAPLKHLFWFVLVNLTCTSFVLMVRATVCVF